MSAAEERVSEATKPPAWAKTEEAEGDTLLNLDMPNNEADDVAQKPAVSIVLQGGGVRGMAHVGALTKLLPKVKPVRFAGTSAGSILAALLAFGVSGQTLKALLETDFRKTFLKVKRLGWLSALQSPFGKHDGAAIEKWTETQLQSALSPHLKDSKRKPGAPVTFADLDLVPGKPELKILTADLRSRQIKIYSKKETPAESVALAVRRSSSIPFFFDCSNDEVDGGLLRNFPIDVFEEYAEPTIGIRLVSSKPIDKAAYGIVQFTGALLETVLEAHDQAATVRTRGVAVITVDTEKVGATDFDLEQDERTKLFDRGAAAVDVWLASEGGNEFLSQAAIPPPQALAECESWLKGIVNIDDDLDHKRRTEVERCAAELATVMQATMLGMGGKFGREESTRLGVVFADLALLLLRQKQVERGVAYAQSALMLAPHHPDVRRLVAESLSRWAALNPDPAVKRALLESSIATLRATLGLEGGWDAAVHHAIGWAEDERKNFQLAITAYEKAIRSPGQSVKDQRLRRLANYNLACACAKAGEIVKAWAALGHVGVDASAHDDGDLDRLKKEDPERFNALVGPPKTSS